MNLVEVLAGEIGPRPAGSEAAARAARAVASAFRDLGVEPTFQEFPFLAYEPEEPKLEVEGVPWRAGPVMYGQSADVEGTVRRIGTHVVLPTLFEPPTFAIEANGRELGAHLRQPDPRRPDAVPDGVWPDARRAPAPTCPQPTPSGCRTVLSPAFAAVAASFP